MQTNKIEETIKKSYSHKFKTVARRINHALEKSQIDLNSLSLDDIRATTTALLQEETKSLQTDVENLLAQKENIERALEKKSEELQESKYEIFNAIEEKVGSNETTLHALHQIKLQSIDLYDILSEMVESAIVTAMEKENELDETLKEVIKEITFEAIKEGSLNTIRVRKILSTILATSIEVAEATPTKADEILRLTLKGMRGGLIKSINRFKQRVAYMPIEAKHILIEDYDTIIEDLNQTDTLFSQIILTQASESSQLLRTMLVNINKDMRFDLEELVLISKETAEIIRERFSNFAKLAVKKADVAFQSPRAQEAKRMGAQAMEAARMVLGSAIKTAKGAIEKKDK
ncbi:DUF6781 family protein [Sulfurimonas sp.]